MASEWLGGGCPGKVNEDQLWVVLGGPRGAGSSAVLGCLQKALIATNSQILAQQIQKQLQPFCKAAAAPQPLPDKTLPRTESAILVGTGTQL